MSHGAPAWIMGANNNHVTKEKLESGFKVGASAYFAYAQKHLEEVKALRDEVEQSFGFKRHPPLRLLKHQLKCWT